MSIVLEAVAGAALSALFDVLFDKLRSSDLLNIFRVDADLNNWEIILREIRDVLDDAEGKQRTNGSVKTWLGDLEALAYDADDILDEFATEALRRKVNAEEPSTSKIRKFIPACCVGFNPSSIKFDVSMRSKIEGIDTKLQGILTRKERLNLLKIVTRKEGQKLQDCAGKRTATSSVAERHTYGRDEDKKKIVKLLLEPSDAQPSVIPIVGMGGLGKTTLAQLVYEDDEVHNYFDLKAWACVSEDFDNLRLTKEILHSFTSEPLDNNSTFDSLQVKLKEKLSGKKFLLVLDDVWNEDYVLWTELRKPFESGALGSKIVVTTRNLGVTSKMGTTPPYKLEELSPDDCLRVFTHHALNATDFSKYPELEEFGQKIVNRCKGVPLAAKVLGGLLRTAPNRNEWEHVLNSKILNNPEEGKIFSVLELSYNYLPPHLKRCFAYCSLFPKDDEFKERDLVLLWMAEGLVQETKREKPMEDLGGDYFRDLLNRSFFQQSSSNKSLFVMHDLMNDLATWAAGDLCCRLEDQSGGSKQSEISTKVEKLLIEDCKELTSLCEDGLMSFVTLEIEIKSCQSLVNIKLKSTLRTLKIEGCDALESLQFVMDEGGASSTSSLLMNEENLTCIGNNNVFLLEHLEIYDCPSLKCVSTIVDLSAMLKRLEIGGCPNLTSLSSKDILPTTLKVLHVDNCPELELIVDELHKDTLLEDLLIRNCEKLRRLPRGLHELCHLKKIYLEERESLISNCPSLKRISFPEEGFHTNLRDLGVSGANLCKQIFELGLHRLTSLTSLFICDGIMDSFLEEEDGKTMLMLPTSLTSLRFYDFPNLLFLSWKFFQNLSALEQISISWCPKLASLSEKCFPPSLQRLEISRCPVLEQNCEKDKGIMWSKIATIPSVWQVLIFGGGGGFGAAIFVDRKHEAVRYVLEQHVVVLCS
ncbi:hypothetical protein ACB094_11G169800 [Castanea mollissima]